MNDFSKPASPQRDELAREIFIADNGGQPREASLKDWEALGRSTQAGKTYAHNIADGLLVAGWTKPRTITEHYGDDGLENLPYRSAIMSAGDVSIAQSDGTWLDSYGSTYDFWEMGLPATVLWEPAL